MEKIEIVLGCTYLNAKFNNVTKLLSERQISYSSTSNRKIKTEHCNICIVDAKFNSAMGLRPDVSFGLSTNAVWSLPKHTVIDYSNGYCISVINFVEAIEKKIPSPYVHRFSKDYIIDAAINIAKAENGKKLLSNKIYGAPSIPKRSGRYPWGGVERNDCLTAPEIEKVIFNNPATIVLWTDGTKTVVKCHDEEFDKEKGLAMAISKRMLGTNSIGSDYYDEFKKWIPEVEEEDNVKYFDYSMAKVVEKFNKALACGIDISSLNLINSNCKCCSTCKYEDDSVEQCKFGNPRKCFSYSNWEQKDE